MTEADFAESFWSAQEMGVNALMLYMTVISGYLVVAYLAGRNLTVSQTRLVSTIFVVFALYAVWGVVEYWWTGDEIRVYLQAGEFGKVATLNRMNLNPAFVAGPMGFAGILGALGFMRDVRKGRNEG